MSSLAGKKIGRWQVLSDSCRIKNRAYWKCRCQCGTEKLVSASNLTGKLTQSCGCLRNDLTQQRNDIKKVTLSSARSAALHALRQQAASRNLVLELTKEQALNLMNQACYYCGAEATNYSKSRAGVIFRHNGIDRVNNDLGYTLANSLPCCKHCNKAKLDLSQADFFDLIRRIYEKHLGLKEEKAS